MLVSDIDPAQEGLLVPPGLVQGYTVHWRRPMMVSPSPNSRGLTDRLNDTVGVTARLQLIFECDWSSQWVAFHQCWADKRDLFSVVFVCVCSLCVCTCTPAVLKRFTREKSLYGHYPGCVGISRSQRWWVLYGLVSGVCSACLLHTMYYTHRCTCRQTLNRGDCTNRILCLGQCVIKPGCLCVVPKFTRLKRNTVQRGHSQGLIRQV